MKIYRALMFWLLLLTVSKVNAQAACPPGTIPYGTGNDPSACGPDNSQSKQQSAPQPPLEKWQDQWGAIATDNQSGKLGASMDDTNQASAESLAMSQCQIEGGTQCKVLISFHNQCGVVIIGDGKINASSAATVAQASQDGLKVCNAGTTNCHVYYSACSLPRRIQ